MVVIVLLIILALSFALQFLAGNFPVGFFAFPLNLICALLWTAVVIWTWKDKKKSLFVSFMISSSATVYSILLLIAACLVIGLTGITWLTATWVFVALLLYFQTVLTFVILKGWRAATPTGARLGPVRWRFLFLHAGLLLTLASGFWGAPDSSTYRMKAVLGVPSTEAYHIDGTPIWLKYEIELKDFEMAESESKVPSDFRADVLIAGEPVTLKVNHPYTVRYGELVYLSGYDAQAGDDSQYCIIQIVREPWKYWALAGIIMMLAGAFMLFIGGPRKRYNDID